MITQGAASRDHKQKKTKANNEKDYEEDLINKLPDGIPGAILSKLPINEAARTSILSTEWRYLWTFYSGTIEFDGSPVMKYMKKNIKGFGVPHLSVEEMNIVYDAERSTYINWINKLLSSLKSPTLQGLKFWFHVGKENEYNADKWVDFAIQNKVQKLELYFGYKFQYILPLQKFRLSSFNSLHVLRLKFITVTEEMLQYLLCCCPLLETLSLVKSQVPKTTKVIGTSLKLKCLELARCWDLEKIEIFAENLVAFKYYGGPHLETELKSVPRLKEATFGGISMGLITRSFIPQIEVLKLDSTRNTFHETEWLFELPILNNIKYLEWVMRADFLTFGGCSMLLLKATPSLLRFTVKMLHTKPIFRAERFSTHEAHFTVKELEFVGFCGAASEVETIIFLVQNSVELLQKVIIDTRLPTEAKLKPLGEHFQTWNHEENRKRALRLQDKIPPGVQFVCL